MTSINNLILWIAIGCAALVADLVTSTFLFVWFTIGSIASIIAYTLGYSFMGQLVTFIAVSVLFMAVGYPLVRKTIKKTVLKTPTMEQEYIGREFIVDDDVIDKSLVKFEGIYWTVKNNGEPIKKGDNVKVLGIKGNSIIIQKI